MQKFVQILSIALVGAGLVACESLKLGDAGLSQAPETSGATAVSYTHLTLPTKA